MLQNEFNFVSRKKIDGGRVYAPKKYLYCGCGMSFLVADNKKIHTLYWVTQSNNEWKSDQKLNWTVGYDCFVFSIAAAALSQVLNRNSLVIVQIHDSKCRFICIFNSQNSMSSLTRHKHYEQSPVHYEP